MTNKPDSTTASPQSLRDHFLIAMPSLNDSYFSNTVTYICDHNEHGAMGVVINHFTDISMTEIFIQLKIDHSQYTETSPVLMGGPVKQSQGLILHRNQGEWTSSLHITPEVTLTASRDILSALSKNEGPKGAQLILGYAGWSAGQLEQELSDNAWLTAPADANILFDTPVEERWSAVAKHIGVDLNLISSSAGHA